MAIKKFRPVTPSQRFRTVSRLEEVTKQRPEKPLTKGLRGTGGRNQHGHVTARRRGGGHKQKQRQVDFRRDKVGIVGRVAAVERDPCRSARLALIHYPDGEKRYILHPLGLTVGDTVQSGPEAEVKVGNTLPLRLIPLGTEVHNVELKPGRGGQLARSAGSSVQVMAKEEPYAHLRLPSGEVRLVRLDCLATVGQVGNLDHENVSFGKAGVSRWLGRRPKVRGVAMNPIDHPMGGGEGKSSGGRHPCTPWGKITKGLKTRRRKTSDRLILKRRK